MMTASPLNLQGIGGLIFSRCVRALTALRGRAMISRPRGIIGPLLPDRRWVFHRFIFVEKEKFVLLIA